MRAAAFDEELRHLLGVAVPERNLCQFAAAATRLRAAGERVEIEESAKPLCFPCLTT